jgi:hypothetical protein
MANHPSHAPLTRESIETLFTYHPTREGQPQQYEEIRAAAKQFAKVIVANCPPCADTTVAVRKVREAVMVANAAIALDPPVGAVK